MGIEVVLVETREDVRGERRRARAGRAQLVLDGLCERRHRRSGDDERRDGRHRLLDGCDRALHRLELVGRLHPPQLVHEGGAGAQPLGAEDARQVERRLRPDAVADGDGPARAKALCDALEDRDTILRLVHDHDLAARLLPEVERREHAREDEHGVRPRDEERARDPAARVRRLAEVRDLALDARQVLEVGRRCEEEGVDALRFHSLRQAVLPLRIVEHDGRVYG